MLTGGIPGHRIRVIDLDKKRTRRVVKKTADPMRIGVRYHPIQFNGMAGWPGRRSTFAVPRPSAMDIVCPAEPPHLRKQKTGKEECRGQQPPTKPRRPTHAVSGQIVSLPMFTASFLFSTPGAVPAGAAEILPRLTSEYRRETGNVHFHEVRERFNFSGFRPRADCISHLCRLRSYTYCTLPLMRAK